MSHEVCRPGSQHELANGGVEVGSCERVVEDGKDILLRLTKRADMRRTFEHGDEVLDER